MNRTSQRRAIGRLPILSAALLSAVGLLWDGAQSGATAQAYSGGSNQVIVNYDVLNALPGQPALNDAARAQDMQPKSQFLPSLAPIGTSTALPPSTTYGAAPGGTQPSAAGLAAPPSGNPSSVLTTVGPDGRPITPITLKRPGSDTQEPEDAEQLAAPEPTASDEPQADTSAAIEGAAVDAQIAGVTPPEDPALIPEGVPMPEPTPPAPAPGVNSGAEPAAPVVEAPQPESAAPAEEAQEEPTEAPAEAVAPAAGKAPAEPVADSGSEAAAAPAAEQPAEGEAAEGEAAEEEEATQEAAAEPDNSQPAAPIPQGGIRIVFPTDLNEVPGEANAALDDLAAQMLADESMRIQIMCYASGTEDTENKARRKSLARCINIRQYLFKKDVRTTRMDVRALGLKSEGQPADRVDIVPANS